MNELTLWIIAKVLNYLKNHEGIKVVSEINNSDAARATIVDSLGFRYEVEIRCLGRNHISEQ